MAESFFPEGKPYSVRHDQLNAMLLNEFLKVHRKNEEQVATIARQQKQIEPLAVGLQKVSAQLELSRPSRQTALHNQKAAAYRQTSQFIL